MNQRNSLLSLMALMGLLTSLMTVRTADTVRAQSGEQRWSDPVNLSRSGAASQPYIAAESEDIVQVFWWDQFDGLMTVYREDGAWTDRAPAPIVRTQIVGEGARSEVVRTTVSAMPTLVSGQDGAHALWLGAADRDTGIRPLLHSSIDLGTTTWSEPQVVAETARLWRMTATSDGILHLLYLRPLHTDQAPAGVYYQRSRDGGVSWTTPISLYETIYFRLVEAEEAHLSLTADAQDGVYATWDDPRRQETFLAVSVDAGAGWTAAQPVAPLRGATRARIVPTNDEPLLLWEEIGYATGCSLYQQQMDLPVVTTDIASQSLSFGDPQPVLRDLSTCPDTPAFYQAGSSDALMILTGEALTATAWNGEQWAEARSIAFSFEHPELGLPVYLGQLQATLVLDRLAVVGAGQGGDIWYVESAIDAWDWVYAPPPPWSVPTSVSQTAQAGGRPALTVDTEGRLHAVWGDPDPGMVTDSQAGIDISGSLTYAQLDTSESAESTTDDPQWSRPAQILQSPEGAAFQPTLVTYEDRIYALWSGGEEGTILFSRAFIRDANAPSGWSYPTPLPMGGVTASSPAALIDAYGVLHVVYAAPLNEGRGIYYVRSDRIDADPESAFGEARPVFDAQSAGFAAVDHPALALDPAGTLHVAWVRGSSGGPFPPQAILHAQSADRGETWSEPELLAEGAYDWPLVAAPVPGEVHVLWNQVEGSAGWTHRWSLDYGETWTYQQPVRGFTGVEGPADLACDGAGDLHLLGLGSDDRDDPAIVYAVWRWEDERWEEMDPLPLDPASQPQSGLSAALQGRAGRLDVAFRAQLHTQPDGEASPAIFHAGRAIPIVAEEQEPQYTPVPTVSPTPSPTPMPSATPRPSVQSEPPLAGPPMVGVGPVGLPLVAVGGLGLALIIIVGVLVSRGGRRHR